MTGMFYGNHGQCKGHRMHCNHKDCCTYTQNIQINLSVGSRRPSEQGN